MKFKHLRRRLIEPLASAAVYLLTAVLACLPRSALVIMSRTAAWPLSWFPPYRKLVLANLAVAFPDQSLPQRRRLARQSAGNLLLTFLEFLWYARHPARFRASVDVTKPEAAEILALARQGGAIFLTPHVGNWELGGQLLAAHGVPFSVVAAKVKNPSIAKLVTAARTFHGMELIAEHGAARGMMKALRQKRSIGLLIDQNTRPREGGVFIPFFGLPAATSRAPASLALHMKTPVLCGALVRVNGVLTLCAERLSKPVSDYADDLELTRELMQLNERFIRRFPDQYLWFYERWRYIPADTPAAERQQFPWYAKEIHTE